ncbi:MAG TPA: PAS domain-containing sensor histidine kinase [Ramlibacter sp.]|nr:PAS domain-containing sensor histidine kinase [Ramlibacter sp.]
MTGPVSIAPWDDSFTRRPDDSAFDRLWRGFAGARVIVATALLALLSVLFAIGPQQTSERGVLLFCGLYVAATLFVRLSLKRPGPHLPAQWLSTIGIDLLVISTLQYLHAGSLNFSPLYAMPVLMAAVLGAAPLAFGVAAATSLALLLDAWAHILDFPAETAQRFLQAGLTGGGYFVLAFLANQLAARLAREEEKSRQSQEAARIQAQVNELVIETLSDGILVVDGRARVRAANPTACALLGHGSALAGFQLTGEIGWAELLELAERTMEMQSNQLKEISVGRAGQASRRVFVRTRLAATIEETGGSLCVLFLEDLREMEARLRTEKLAAMGRMSAAVAHEIRNPLAAIAQANALLDEDLVDPTQRQLSGLIQQNTRRLAQIVDEILDVSRARQQIGGNSVVLDLDAGVGPACEDWARQTQSHGRMRTALRASSARAPFEADHLRRVLVNLLDNALRYAGGARDSIQVTTYAVGAQAYLCVWSDGAPLDPTVQRHLFEPFFSSEARSSGLGLYICRELCERHGAQIAYRRGPAPMGAQPEGNEFFISFLPAPMEATGGGAPATIAA